MVVNSNTAIVIDALPGMGGAEKVLIAALELFPNAPIYTLIYNRDQFVNTPIEDREVKSSFIEHLPVAGKHYRKYLPLMPFAIRQHDLSSYETIVSFSYAVANGVRLCEGQNLLSYTFTPMRYAWSDLGLDGKQRQSSPLLDLIFKFFRKWDREAANRVNSYAAVSSWIAGWIQNAYNRKSKVIYPPVEIERFSADPVRDDYFITIARLVPHKRIDLLVDAFNALKLPLVIIGKGPEREKLEKRAADNIRFMGFQTDDAVADLLSRARAYICTGKEDFGIAMVEAQAAGCPVVAFGEGGAREIVREDQTGLFFEESQPESLIAAIERFNTIRFDIHACTTNAMRFNKGRFVTELKTFIDQVR